ncbi:ubiquitin-conjugating enzyme/RWD-like protein [Hygrophoropsis aurantiaca]|uniref:Ubiquitin-conjugating enzyme/RWD-like protein n=1 Tax=Hygrophoropsis aurantiaca TaxID=72124 RepID=A0ACB8A8L9_9AGAM|nr:ubiquitin-conjugating enzyme/RWD-like protein [Hygrophoropsis aurantiaca]
MAPPLSSPMTIKRIHREVADAQKEDLGAITLGPSSDNLFHWTGTIPGPQGSPYEGGIFHIDIHLAADYPFSAPKVTFATRIYHMNISDKGGICIDILKQNWSPALSLFKVVLSLSSLLTDPNPQDPLVPSIATEYVRSRAQHDRTARQWTELYALPPPQAPKEVSKPSITVVSNPGAKNKGKGRAVPAAPSSNASSSSTARPSRVETIVLDDSDDEVTSTTSARRAGKKRQRGGSTVDIDLVEEERTTTRRRLNTRMDRDGGGARSSTSSRSMGRVRDSEVIVIDD